MDALAAARATAAPLNELGSAFYFSPQAAARAGAIGLDVFLLYAGGRGGILGDRTSAEVDEEFFFFKPGMITLMVEAARASADPAAIVEAHLGAADDYARATFGGTDPAAVAGFDAAARAVVDTLPSGSWPLVDGYRSAGLPADPVASAYRQTVILRELRGGVHLDAVVAAGLTAAVACQFDRGDDYYALHGFSDDDRVPETPELLATRVAAEEATDVAMADLFADLDTGQRSDLAAGAGALFAALSEPVPVN
jgi:hypothetical protein